MASLKVAVTGGTGYLANEVVRQLLLSNYTVHATVRNLQSQATEIFHKLFPTVKLFEADLLSQGSFDKAFEGVDFVLHTASPFFQKVDDPQRDLVDPALLGTKNVLGSVEKYPTIKRVVVTGSCASVVEHFPTDDGNKVWTEDDWNTTSSLTDGPYRYSKTVAERYTWEWAEKHPSVIVSVMLPTVIIGPPLSNRTDAVSIKVVKELLDGTTKAAGGTPAVAVGAVDIRDVATAHVLALEKPGIKGRYILSSERGIPRLEFAEILRKDFGNYPLPDKQIGELQYRFGSLTPNGKYSNAKARKELGIEFTPIDKSLIETAHKLIELGVVPKLK